MERKEREREGKKKKNWKPIMPVCSYTCEYVSFLYIHRSSRLVCSGELIKQNVGSNVTSAKISQPVARERERKRERERERIGSVKRALKKLVTTALQAPSMRKERGKRTRSNPKVLFRQHTRKRT